MRFAEDPGDVPDFVAARDHFVGELVSFIRALRAAGVEVPANAALVGARALIELGVEDAERTRIALQAALISRHEDIPVFERLFPEFWRRLADRASGGDGDDDADLPAGGLAPLGDIDPPSTEDSPSDNPADTQVPSDDAAIVESLGSRVAAANEGEESTGSSVSTSVYSPTGSPSIVTVPASVVGQGDDLARPVARLTTAIAGLQGRRWTREGDERIDTRRALRRSFSTGGTVLSVPEQDRKQSAVRALLLVDVSQSVLDTIDRGFLIRFLRRVADAWRHVRIFFFDTRVREVTDAFHEPTPALAVAALERAEAEWGGGTRIGHALSTIQSEAPEAVDRDTVTFVISDGLEVGELDVLAEGMSWLSRRSAAVLWLNPLAASPQYEPTCRGMEIALPYVNGVFAFAAPGDITEIARQIERQGLYGTLGFEYDPRRTASA